MKVGDAVIYGFRPCTVHKADMYGNVFAISTDIAITSSSRPINVFEANEDNVSFANKVDLMYNEIYDAANGKNINFVNIYNYFAKNTFEALTTSNEESFRKGKLLQMRRFTNEVKYYVSQEVKVHGIRIW